MLKIGIIAALDCEIKHFIKDYGAENTVSGIYKGMYVGKEIYLTLCGIGKVNAAICAQRLIDIAGVDCIINSGVAGSVLKKLNVCDVAISEQLTYHDFHPIELLDKYSPNHSVFDADKKLVSLAQSACHKFSDKNPGFKYCTGMIVSGDIFVDDKAYNEMLFEKYNALCTEMEGAAVAHTAIVNNIPFVVIRAISDNADENADMSFDKMAEIAAERASFIVKDLISQL